MEPWHSMKLACPLSVFAVISASYAGVGHAAPSFGVECALVDPELVTVDGMVDEWSGIRGQRVGDKDLGLEIRCAQDEKKLYMLASVRDDSVIRTSKQRKNNQDALSLRIGADRVDAWSRLDVAPGTRGYEPLRLWGGGKARSPIDVADSLQPDGWSVEVAVPFSQLRAWGRGTPVLRYVAELRDADGGGADTLTMRGALRFAGSTDVYRGFMQQTHLSRSDVTLDVLANVNDARGVERVIAGGKFVGVLTDEYRYLQLPVDNTRDVLDVRLLDVAGGGKESILTHYREHGNGGSREVVAVWNLRADGSFARSLAFEVRKEMDGNLLTNAWRLEPKGTVVVDEPEDKRKKKRPRPKKAQPGLDIVVEVGEVRGWDENSFGEAPAEDMRPILTPWGDRQSVVYTFEGDEAFGGEPTAQ